MTDEASDIISVDQLAVYLKLNRKTVYDMVTSGELPGARRCRGTIRIHKPTVIAWLEQGELPKHRKRK